jgi:hypothetical protein
VESARLRAKVLEDIRMYTRFHPISIHPSSLYPDAQAEYGAGNINQLLANMQQQLLQIGNDIRDVRADVRAVELQVRIARAETTNAWITTRNFQIQGGLELAPRQKTVSHQNCPKFLRLAERYQIEGSGLLLAEGLATSVANRDALHVAFQDHPLANIGDVPPFFRPEIELYQHSHILLLIAFYNDNLGITLHDTLPQRHIKLRKFLTELL